MNNSTMKKYFQGVIIAVVIIFAGIFAEIFTKGAGVTMPEWPFNIIILFVFVLYIILLHFFWKSEIKTWLSSISATITAIGAYAFLVILMGFIPQIDQTAPNWVKLTGLSHINRSWEFLFLSIYMLLILGLVILRRVRKLNFRNVAFLLNHLGIFVVISAASVSTGDLQRLTLPIAEGQTSNYAYKDKNTLVEIPFSVELVDFNVEYYVPELIVFNPHSRLILNDASVDYSIEDKKEIEFKEWKFTVVKYYSNAIRQDSTFIQNNDTAISEFAVLIEIRHQNDVKEAWISSGNYLIPALSTHVTDDLAISLSLPQDKKYVSTINLISDAKELKNVKILVNFPFKFQGYNIYQQGFDDKNPENVDVSILE
ncbi:MAG: cytochrome c biogenesis protein ResB, partial [Bacteroidota bacterium]|nr:cytochrome c biogenesis protein ResB [Bacteroidota bacterium]